MKNFRFLQSCRLKMQPNRFMQFSLIVIALTVSFTIRETQAALILPNAISVSAPTGSNNPNNGPYVDDVYLESLTFTGVTFNGSSNYSAVRDIEVTRQRGHINAEWGDRDTASDGDDNPFVKAGYGSADQETTDPVIQDTALTNSFNSLSLSEMSDGESGGFQFKALFQNGLTDNDSSGVDGVPELVFFERGMNDRFRVEAIVGGTFDNPIYSQPFVVNSSNFWGTDILVNTVEIGGSQEIGVAGIDLNDFGMGEGDTIYGFRLTVESGGPDLNGFFLSTDDPGNFKPALPIPGAVWLLGPGLVGIIGLRRKFQK